MVKKIKLLRLICICGITFCSACHWYGDVQRGPFLINTTNADVIVKLNGLTYGQNHPGFIKVPSHQSLGWPRSFDGHLQSIVVSYENNKTITINKDQLDEKIKSTTDVDRLYVSIHDDEVDIKVQK